MRARAILTMALLTVRLAIQAEAELWARVVGSASTEFWYRPGGAPGSLQKVEAFASSVGWAKVASLASA